MTLLVTGGAGFIGANFVLDWIAGSDESVVNLDKLTYAGNLQTLASLQGNPRHIFVQGDIGDRALVERLLAEHQPRAVVNFAAESHVDRSIHGPGDFVQTNIVGTFNLLESVRGYAWLDTGTHDSLLEAAGFIATLQKRQGLMVACPEEIAFHQKWIDAAALQKLAQPLAKNGYGQYLLNLLK